MTLPVLFSRIRFISILVVLALVQFFRLPLPAADVLLRPAGSNLMVRIDGDPDNDWRLQFSGNLTQWVNLTNFGTLLAGRPESAPERSVGPATNAARYYRALKTGGLYDPTLFRTISLTFTQANWTNLLSTARNTGSNVYCSLLTLDNGASTAPVGARYKGNTSFSFPGAKKSFNLEFDWGNTNGELMGYTTLNLNNAAGDETIMREPIYFTIMSRYTPCPKAAMARVHVNGSLWGVFSLAQQENGQLIREWFPSNNGDRWRTPNAPSPTANSAFGYLGTTNIGNYQSYYDLRTTNSPSATAWQRLVNAIYALHNTPADQFRDRMEDFFAVDNWLWFLAIENLFADDDSYWNKGADFSFYYEIESGRIHPVEHDGNEALSVTNDVSLSPVQGAASTTRPLLNKFLPVPELRQRYLAHLRTVLERSYHPAVMTPFIDQFHALSIQAVIADPIKSYTMAAYTNDLRVLKLFVTNRYNFLTNHAELRPRPPVIVDVFDPAPQPTAAEIPFVTARVDPDGTNGIDSVWLYWRDKSHGRFAVNRMWDDGAHGDGAPGDGLYGGATTNFPAGAKIHYYVEARSANAARAAKFHPEKAENDTHAYFVAVTSATNSAVILNEVMASNTSTLADPQGEYDDWIELRNLTDHDVDMTGRYLSDEANNPQKWAFPAGTIIPANGYLLIWADEDGAALSGLHASFKLSATGETLYLVDTDANFNAILDQVTFTGLGPDQAYGRNYSDADTWQVMAPTPGGINP